MFARWLKWAKNHHAARALPRKVYTRLSTCNAHAGPRRVWKTARHRTERQWRKNSHVIGSVAAQRSAPLIHMLSASLPTPDVENPDAGTRSAGLCPAALRPDRNEAALRARRAEPGATVATTSRGAAEA